MPNTNQNQTEIIPVWIPNKNPDDLKKGTNVVHRWDNKKETHSAKHPSCEKIRGHCLYGVNYSRGERSQMISAMTAVSIPSFHVGGEGEALND